MVEVILATTDQVPGREIVEVLGVVSASVAMARWFGADLMAGIRDFFGGRVKEYEKLMRDATDEVFKKLAEEAKKMGANAVVGIKMFSPEIGGERRVGEVVAYGTAVKLKEI